MVEAEASADGRLFNGLFRCDPGFTLSGASQVKCRDGFWSAKIPLCIGNTLSSHYPSYLLTISTISISTTSFYIYLLVTTCDPNQLPTISNGKRVQVKGSRAGMYR